VRGILVADLWPGDGAEVELREGSDGPILRISGGPGTAVRVFADAETIETARSLDFARQLDVAATEFRRALEEHVARLMAADMPDPEGRGSR
jgi:hypothetical protein